MADPALVAPTAPLPPRHSGFSLDDFLNSMHTHFVAVVGMRTIYVAVAARIAIIIIDKRYPDTTATHQIADTIGMYLVAPTLAGAYAAYFGKSKNRPPDDATQVAIAETSGAPRPLTPAQP